MFSLVLFAASGRTETYLVNPEGTGDFPDLETALEQVVDGDIIELADGAYGDSNFGEGFDFLGKAITVRSQSGNPEQCAIQYSPGYAYTESGVTFQSGEGPLSVLEGITVTAGFYASSMRRSNEGGCSFSSSSGVLVKNGSSPTLSNLLLNSNPIGVNVCDSSPIFVECRFTSNGSGLSLSGSSFPFAVSSCTFEGNAQGIVCDGASGTITGCVLSKNTSSGTGVILAGLYLRGGSTVVVDSCLIQGNGSLAQGDFRKAGGVVVAASEATITNCLISGNISTSERGGGISIDAASDVAIDRCTIAGNRALDGGGLALDSPLVSVERSIVWGNCASSGSADEIFVGASGVLTFECSLSDSNGVDGAGTVQWIGTNVFLDPLFTSPRPCEEAPTTEGNYCPTEFSPAWHVPGCGNLGAVLDDCSIAVTPTSWGQIKALYR